MRKLFILLVFALAIGAVSFFSVTSCVVAQTEGRKAMTEEELIPSEKPLRVKFLPVAPSPANVNVKGLSYLFMEAEPLTVKLQMQDLAFPNGGGSIKSVSIKGFHDGAYIYFLLEWTDASEDNNVLTGHGYRDATALMFPIGIYTKIDVAHPFSPRMGDRGKPVNIWHWKADWQRDLSIAAKLVDLESEYPAMHDDYASDPYNLAVRSTLYRSAPFVAGGVAANNILSLPKKGSPVEDLNAIGFGTLTTQEHQDVNGNGVWKDGTWRVLLTRPLTTPDTNDTQFVPGGGTVLNVAVWNGSEEDRNGQKNISLSWHPVLLEKIDYELLQKIEPLGGGKGQ